MALNMSYEKILHCQSLAQDDVLLVRSFVGLFHGVSLNKTQRLRTRRSQNYVKGRGFVKNLIEFYSFHAISDQTCAEDNIRTMRAIEGQQVGVLQRSYVFKKHAFFIKVPHLFVHFCSQRNPPQPT